METQAPIIAFLYDFDKTLCTTDMEDYAFIPSLGYTPAEFWGRANAFGWENRMDGLLAYMYTMIQECAAQNIKLDRAFLNHCGESIQLFPGVREWFARINAFGESLGVQVEHYVISSGLREIIEGSGIAQEFREIYACEFYYNENGDACWPKLDVNFTNKTQFVYRINKGILDVSRDKELNDSMPDDSKRVPFTNMIYMGDGLSDVPCMKMMRAYGGQAIAVYQASNRQGVEKLLADEIANGRVELRDIEGLTIENRTTQGKALPDEVLAAIKDCDVLLKGPTETPKGGTLESANVAMRRELDLFANVRPVSVPKLGIDWTFFRENTEGEYALGSRGVEVPGMLSMDFKVTTDAGTRRIAKAAFDFARANGKTNVAIVTKANIMKKTDGMFTRICHEVAADYPEITAEDWYIDIMTANLVNPEIRSRFQVFVLPNLYGDIITDEAAQIQGGVGTAGSANTGSQYAMFEAVHGTAPRLIADGEGDYANPASILKAAELLLRHIAMADKADQLAAAMSLCVETERRVVMTGHRDGASCAQFVDYLLEKL